MPSDFEASLVHLDVYARAAVGAAALPMDRGDLDAKFCVFAPPLTDVTLGPSVVAAPRDFQDTAHHRDREIGLLRTDELEPHECSFAKKAAAFLRLSAPSRAL